MDTKHLQELDETSLQRLALKFDIFSSDSPPARNKKALIQELEEAWREQKQEQIRALSHTLKEELSKFDFSNDIPEGFVEPVPPNYAADCLGNNRNALSFLLRDSEWGVAYWNLAKDIRQEISRTVRQFPRLPNGSPAPKRSAP